MKAHIVNIGLIILGLQCVLASSEILQEVPQQSYNTEAVYVPGQQQSVPQEQVYVPVQPLPIQSLPVPHEPVFIPVQQQPMQPVLEPQEQVFIPVQPLPIQPLSLPHEQVYVNVQPQPMQPLSVPQQPVFIAVQQQPTQMQPYHVTYGVDAYNSILPFPATRPANHIDILPSISIPNTNSGFKLINKKDFNMLCTNGARYFPYPGNCHKFIHCSNNIAYEFNCPSGLYWNSKLLTCDYNCVPANGIDIVRPYQVPYGLSTPHI